MKTNTGWFRILELSLTAILLLTACGGAASTPTVVARGTTCTYSGPQQVPAKLSITWDVQATTPSMDYAFVVVTLGEGKTAADLQQYMGTKDAFMDTKSAVGQSWITDMEFTTPIQTTTSQTIDLATNAGFHGGPLYVVCLSHTAPFAVVGPIQVQQ